MDQARATYTRMASGSRRMQPNRHTFRLMMGIFLQAGSLQEALQVYTDMRRVGEGLTMPWTWASSTADKPLQSCCWLPFKDLWLLSCLKPRRL